MKNFIIEFLTAVLIAVSILAITWVIISPVKASEFNISDNCLAALSANANAKVADKACLEDYTDELLMSQQAINNSCKDVRNDVRLDQRQVMIERIEKRISLKGAIPFCNSLRNTRHG